MTAARLRDAATWLMGLALALAPAYVVRTHFGPLPTTLLEIVLVPAIALGWVAFRAELPWRSPYAWPAALLLVAASLDTLLAPDRRAALGIWKAYFVEPVAAGLVIAAMARSRDRARIILAGLALGAVWAGLANAYVDGHAILTHTFNKVTPQVALYNSANDTALFQEPVAAFALAVAFSGGDRRERVAGALVYVVAALAILLSYSRLGWISLIVLTLFVAAFSPWRRWILAATAVIAVAAFAASHTVRDRILVEFNPDSPDNTLRLRIPLWKSTLNMLIHRPLFGGGLSGFQKSVEPYRDPAFKEPLIYPHNLLLNFWSETGVLGLAAFLWLLVQVLRVGRRLLKAGAWPRTLGIGLLAMLLAVVVHGLGDVPYFKNDLAISFWALLAVPAGALMAADNRSQP